MLIVMTQHPYVYVKMRQKNRLKHQTHMCFTDVEQAVFTKTVSQFALFKQALPDENRTTCFSLGNGLGQSKGQQLF